MTKPLSDIARWRRHIHAHPETAYEEVGTAKMVAELLTEFGYEVTTGIGRTGVVGVLSRGAGPRVGLRADMDALPIHEKTGLPHASTHAGKMHACGHDGHTAMLLGAARALAEATDWQGTIVLIFQPAEENAGGALTMIEDGLFDRFEVDAVFGMHNWPGLPAGTIAVRAGEMMAAFDPFDVTLKGTGGHAAMPHLGTDTLLAAARFVTEAQGIVSRRVDPQEAAVLSVTQVHGGDAYNVLPSEVVIRGCVRTFSPKVRAQIEEALTALAHQVADAAGLTATVEYDKRYAPTINSPDEAALAARAAAEALGEDKVVTDFKPSMASEDFGAMLEAKPGAYVWIGNDRAEGDNFGLHHDRYDFNDDVLEPGVRYWTTLAKRFLTERAAS